MAHTTKNGAPPYLRRRNPTVKFAAALALSLLLVAVIDPATPLLVLGTVLLCGVLAGGIRPASYARAMAPLLLVALGFVWTNALFAVAPPDASVLWRWGPLRVSEAGLRFGIAIALRGLAIGALSLTFVLTTDPTDLVISLIRHGHLPYRIGYALLAGYRFLPFFAQEYEQVRLAQRVRGRVDEGTPAEWMQRRLRSLLPLVASAVRRAARVAVAMDARAFAAARQRTFYREVALDRRDALFMLAAAAVAAALAAVSAAAGWLRLWDGRFSA